MDEIYIKGLKIFAYHGVNPEETENGQEFELDITMFADLSKAREAIIWKIQSTMPPLERLLMRQ